MNSEQHKFKKVIKARRLRERWEKFSKDKNGLKIPLFLLPERKSKKFKPKKK